MVGTTNPVLKFTYPRLRCILVFHQAFNSLARNPMACRFGIPYPSQSSFDTLRGQLDIGQKVFVRTILPIAGLFGWQRQMCFDRPEIHLEEKNAMEQQIASLAPLGIAAKLRAAEREIAGALNFNAASNNGLQGELNFSHNEPIRFRDALERT
jgi:hypothetical protein